METSQRLDCIDCLTETVFVASERGERHALRYGDGGIFNPFLDIPVTVSACREIVLSDGRLRCLEPEELLICGAPWEPGG